MRFRYGLLWPIAAVLLTVVSYVGQRFYEETDND